MFGVGPPGVLLVIAYIPGIRELHEQWTQSYVLLSFFGGFLVGGDQEKDKIIFDSFIASFDKSYSCAQNLNARPAGQHLAVILLFFAAVNLDMTRGLTKY